MTGTAWRGKGEQRRRTNSDELETLYTAACCSMFFLDGPRTTISGTGFFLAFKDVWVTSDNSLPVCTRFFFF